MDSRIEWDDLKNWFRDENREKRLYDMGNYSIHATNGHNYHSITISRKTPVDDNHCLQSQTVLEALNQGIGQALPKTVMAPGASSSRQGRQSLLSNMRLKFLGSDDHCIYYGNESSNLFMLALFVDETPSKDRVANAIAIILDQLKENENYETMVGAIKSGLSVLDTEFERESFQEWFLQAGNDQRCYEFGNYKIAYLNEDGAEILILTSRSSDPSILDFAENASAQYCTSEDKTFINQNDGDEESNGENGALPSIFDD